MRIKQDWSALIGQWQASGLSKLAFCKSLDVPYQSFIWNLKRREEPSSGEFRELIVREPAFGDRIDYHFPDGRCVSFPCSAPRELVRFLLTL